MPRFMVKNKFTYGRVRQEDYSYRPDFTPYSYSNRTVSSQNYVPELFQAEDAAEKRFFKIPGENPVEEALPETWKKLFKSVSGFRISCAQGQKEDGIIRFTLFGAGGESFMTVASVADTAGENGRCFSIERADFEPVRFKLECAAGDEVSLKICPVYVKNTLGEWGGQAHFYNAGGDASIADKGTAVSLRLSGKGYLTAENLPTDAGGCYGMKMPLRNTVFAVIRNFSDAKRITLSFAADGGNFKPENAVTLDLHEDKEPHAYYFNLSACPGCEGRLTSLRFESEGTGEIVFERYSFEQETPLYEPLAEIVECTAEPDKDTFFVRARFPGNISAAGLEKLAEFKGGKLSVYAGTMADDTGFGPYKETVSGKKYLASAAFPEKIAAGAEFVIENVPFRDNVTTFLPYQMLVFAEKEGKSVCLCDRFYIENFECLDGNPYRFELPERTVSVTEFGAKGDGFTDDTAAIQKAIDSVSDSGGGTVNVPGADGIYGRRFIVTSLLMRDNVELHLEKGAVLWQSQLRRDYTYEPAYGHDDIIPGINWTHNLHTANLPLIQAANNRNIKITGHGAIRMLDTGSEENVGMPGYSVGCYRRIHCIPLGFFLCKNVEVSGIEIIRSNNYHTSFNHCENVYLADLKLHRVKCVSGDGLGVCGAKNVFVNRCFFQSNDDAVVMSTHYHDPRGLLWWTNTKGEDNSVRHITVRHSYLNSGGGKAICFITWGTSDPIQEREEISDVEATDNYLTCVNPVGAWFDNPYNGKQPFDNTETDDYSPVKCVRIFGNRYNGNCTLGPIKATDIITDCGITSAADFRNGDFTLGGFANWTLKPNKNPESVHTVIYADKEKGCIEHFEYGRVSASEGLRLANGRHVFRCELLTGESGAVLFAEKILTGERIASKTVVATTPVDASLEFTVDGADGGDDVYVGVENAGINPGGFAVFDFCRIESSVDGESIAAAARAKLTASLGKMFDLPENSSAENENKKVYLRCKTMSGETSLRTLGEYTEFSLECAFRANDYDYSRVRNGFGFRTACGENGFYELRFNVPAKTLVFTSNFGGVTKELFRREVFFFTSLDFHNFRLETGKNSVLVWIDSGLFCEIPAPAKTGFAEVFMTDMDASLNGLSVE